MFPGIRAHFGHGFTLSRYFPCRSVHVSRLSCTLRTRIHAFPLFPLPKYACFPAFVHTSDKDSRFPAISLAEVCMFPGFCAHFGYGFMSSSAISLAEVCMFPGFRAHFGRDFMSSSAIPFRSMHLSAIYAHFGREISILCCKLPQSMHRTVFYAHFGKEWARSGQRSGVLYTLVGRSKKGGGNRREAI